MRHAADRDKQVQQSGTERHRHKTGGIKWQESLYRLVFYLEIVVSIQEKTAENTAMVTDYVGNNIIQPCPIQQGEHTEIHSRVNHTDAAIQNEIPIFLK